ncbi:unnamed protein product [Periconia digitata]|uniref:Uncharacterized protein n=1 Tax=Periconia digitata TaxID=1303443 RepID=A0A9W4XS79_9PLEO|nr:unnamed protein product [Periconia digitata]
MSNKTLKGGGRAGGLIKEQTGTMELHMSNEPSTPEVSNVTWSMTDIYSLRMRKQSPSKSCLSDPGNNIAA